MTATRPLPRGALTAERLAYAGDLLDFAESIWRTSVSDHQRDVARFVVDLAQAHIALSVALNGEPEAGA